MYQALYREFRPNTFDDVLGQDHIVNTIKNQIISGSIGHAYLFSGTRGTGKTSTAKIFSRAVNCLNPQDGSPCNQCHNCKGILDGSIMDVIEMDAASNRGVNDIRELRDMVVYPPSHGKYKVYIIDEVHMLTQEAFNALLKTLEEPPKHLIFILATTEPEKIPATILSRCQRFDFKRIGMEDIIENMEKISEKIGVEIDKKALATIARNADGGMRDALSLLDQALSHSKEGRIEYEDALSILGIVNKDLVFNMVDSILEKDMEKILYAVDDFMEEGRDVSQFIKDIIKHFRDLMIVKNSKEAAGLIQVDELTFKKYREQAEKIELTYILEILEILIDIGEKSKNSSHPRTILEMGLIRIVNGENLSLEERVVRLEAGGVSPIQVDRRDRPKKDRPKTPVEIREIPKEAGGLELEGPKEAGDQEKEAEGLASPKPAQGSDIPLEAIAKHWDEFISSVRREKASVSGLLIEGRPVDIINGMVIIEFGKQFEFHKNAAERNMDYIKDALRRFYNVDLDLKLQLESEFNSLEDKKKDDEELVQEIKDFFGSDRVEIEQ